MPAKRIALPSPSVPFVDPQTGLIDPVWYLVLQALVLDYNKRVI